MATKLISPLVKIPVSPEPLYRLLFGRPMTEMLYAAKDLGIFQLLTDAPRSSAELCAALHLPSHSTDMLLNTCVALGLLKKEDDRYGNTPLADHYLVTGKPFYLGGLLEHFRNHVYPAWDHLRQAVQEDGPQVNGEHGKSHIFAATTQENRDTELFIAAMHNLSVSDGLWLAEHFDFSAVGQLLDIGGGSGALCLAVASRYETLQATVFDRPQVCAIANRYIAQVSMAERVRTHPGDAFKDPLPVGMDAILMSLFIHAFGLERCAPLLKKCYDALRPGGCLLIYEPMLDGSRTGPLTTLLSSLNMLVVTPSGGDTTAADYEQALRRAGFENVFYKPVPTIRHLVGGYKPR